jgi:hypothetical protein
MSMGINLSNEQLALKQEQWKENKYLEMYVNKVIKKYN